MKIKKTVTPAVIAANRQNSTKATGPKDVAAVKQNAISHGLLAKRLAFQSPEEKAEFDDLMIAVEAEYEPVGPTECALVEELGLTLWKLTISNGLELQELRSRRQAALALLQTVADYDNDQLPLFTKQDGSPSAAQLGWELRVTDCQNRK